LGEVEIISVAIPPREGIIPVSEAETTGLEAGFLWMRGVGNDPFAKSAIRLGRPVSGEGSSSGKFPKASMRPRMVGTEGIRGEKISRLKSRLMSAGELSNVSALGFGTCTGVMVNFGFDDGVGRSLAIEGKMDDGIGPRVNHSSTSFSPSVSAFGESEPPSSIVASLHGVVLECSREGNIGILRGVAILSPPKFT